MTGMPLRFFFFGGTRLSGPPRNVGQSIALQRARRACPSDGDLDGDITPSEGGLPCPPIETKIKGGDREDDAIKIKVFRRFGR